MRGFARETPALGYAGVFASTDVPACRSLRLPIPPWGRSSVSVEVRRAWQKPSPTSTDSRPAITNEAIAPHLGMGLGAGHQLLAGILLQVGDHPERDLSRGLGVRERRPGWEVDLLLGELVADVDLTKVWPQVSRPPAISNTTTTRTTPPALVSRSKALRDMTRPSFECSVPAQLGLSGIISPVQPDRICPGPRGRRGNSEGRPRPLGMAPARRCFPFVIDARATDAIHQRGADDRTAPAIEKISMAVTSPAGNGPGQSQSPTRRQSFTTSMPR